MKEKVYFLNMFPDYEPPEELTDVLSQAAIVAADIDPVKRRVELAMFTQQYIPYSAIEAVETGITEEALLKEAQSLIQPGQSRRGKRYLYGPIWACGGAAMTGLAWMLTLLL